MPERRTESREDPFQAATFEGAAELRRTMVRKMSLHDRMRWLEEMNQLIAYQKGAKSRRTGDRGPSTGSGQAGGRRAEGGGRKAEGGVSEGGVSEGGRRRTED